MTSRIAAFFDLDNTIVAGPAIEYPYFRLLWSRGLVGPKDLLRSAGVLLRDIPPFSFDPLRRYKAYREGKRLAAVGLAAEQGLDLGASFMYGDSPGDLPALEAVGQPRVVNPIRGMIRIARRRGWPILNWS